MSDQEKHAITGAFGFSGKYIAQRLLDDGREVVTLTNSPNRPNPFGGRVKPFPFAFDDPEKMARSLEGVSVLYNTYWVRFNHQSFSHEQAVKNTLSLFRAAKLAGVKRVVHVSISNANPASSLEYFRGKGQLEEALQESGISCAILRPAVLFGDGGILINNIAWALRRLPVFGVFGHGDYHLQPIYVDDLAKLAVQCGAGRDNVVMPALGPETFTYRKLVAAIGRIIGRNRPIIGVPREIGLAASRLVGTLVNDVFVTKEEIDGLMADLLHVPGAAPTGETKLTDWIKAHKDELGVSYQSEMARRRDRMLPY